ncbi:sigma-70 family RNA polymerase sigma factor [Novosphingobium sp. PC22D]|uniref:RNA polymerase sigma factor n=1 Tax=Novosphingobium sp. PC22D TaxID=1962403 RepID=UPI000BF0B5E0|nr:sigma-70 family RNA polymerase sigma factor [Novosphingobium sp. PC22D]
MTLGRESGGAAGLAALLVQLQPELLRFLTARCGDPDEAQDLLQDLWLKLEEIETGPIANGRAYLYRMAGNLVLDRVRGRRRAMARDRRWIDADGGAGVAPVDRPDPAPPADEALVEKEESAVLAKAIEDLPAGARRALRLYRFEDRRQSEIAEIMGISRSGVEKHLALAMRHLRDALSDCGFFGAAASHRQQQSRGGGSRRDKRT